MAYTPQGFFAKALPMQTMLNELSMKTFGRTASDALNTRTCVDCGEDASGFKDAISEKEYHISALCQSCQDGVFG